MEHWACPRLWRVGRGSVSVFAGVFLIWFLFVGGVCGGCSWLRLQSVRRVSLCFFIRHDREVATHSSCSAKSSHFVRDTGARVEGWHDLLTSTMVPTKSSSA